MQPSFAVINKTSKKVNGSYRVFMQEFQGQHQYRQVITTLLLIFTWRHILQIKNERGKVVVTQTFVWARRIENSFTNKWLEPASFWTACPSRSNRETQKISSGLPEQNIFQNVFWTSTVERSRVKAHTIWSDHYVKDS